MLLLLLKYLYIYIYIYIYNKNDLKYIFNFHNSYIITASHCTPYTRRHLYRPY